MATITLADKTRELIERIEKAVTDPKNIKVTKTGTFYVVPETLTDYSFELYFVYNSTETPLLNKDGNPIVDSNGNPKMVQPLFTQPTVDHITYNLKGRTYSLERNGKQIAFSEENLRKSFQQMPAEEMSFLETDGNKGFFVATRKFGRSGNERQQQISRQLVNLIENYPGLEFVYKAGLYYDGWEDSRWNQEFRAINPKATNLLDFFGFKINLQLKIFRRMNKLTGYQNGRFLMLRNLEEKDLLYIRDILDLSEMYNHKYGLNKTSDILSFFGLASGYYYGRSDNLHENDKYIANLPRFIEYLFYEADVKQAFTQYRTYIDYVKYSLELGSKFNRYPASILTSHDIAYRYFSMIRYNDDLKEKFTKEVAKLDCYEGDIKGTEYTIVAPREMEDIIYEGVELSHCVKAYIPSIANGETSIVFLRDKKTAGKPLYTIEIKDNCVIQAAGFCNCDLTQDALDALDIFMDTYLLGKAF
jgi:hypothetical protein